MVNMKLQSMKRQAVPLHAEVAAVLRHQILSGELVPGTRLPSLRELAEELGVARMTVIQSMNALEEEGLVEKHPGRGTFVCDVKKQPVYTLQMKADMSQMHSMVEQLEVSVRKGDATIEKSADGRYFRCMRRIHAKNGKPFCQVDIRLDDKVFDSAPDRFTSEIVVSVLKALGISVAMARQRTTISYADFFLAASLGIKVNTAVFRVSREFLDDDGKLIYSATLYYPGDQLALEIEFVNSAHGYSNIE